MGLNIGAIARDISVFRPRLGDTGPAATARTPERAAREVQPPVPRPTSRIEVGSNVGILFNRESTERIRAGFGENTISPPAAALLTLDETVQAVAANVPTLEEQRAILRERLAELREAQERPPVEVPERLELDPSRGFAAEQTREIANRSLEADPAVRVEPRGNEEEAPRAPAVGGEINQQVFGFPRENTPQFIDVLA
jgi:hypothetical protein